MTAEAPLFLLRASSRCRFRGVFFTRPKRCNGITRCLSLPPALRLCLSDAEDWGE